MQIRDVSVTIPASWKCACFSKNSRRLLIDRYKISVSQLIMDMFHLSYSTSRSFPHAYTDSDYPFGIFKFFLYLSCITKAKYCRRLRWKACSTFQSIKKAIPLSFRRYLHVHISVFLLIRAYILILELTVINVIGLVLSDIALLTGNWTCLTGPPVRKSNISGRHPGLMTYNVVISLPYRHLCIYCRQWCSTQDSFII